MNLRIIIAAKCHTMIFFLCGLAFKILNNAEQYWSSGCAARNCLRFIWMMSSRLIENQLLINHFKQCWLDAYSVFDSALEITLLDKGMVLP